MASPSHTPRYYKTTITSKPTIPPDAPRSKEHHIKNPSTGKLVRFQNPHPSFGADGTLSFFQTFRKFFLARIAGEMVAPDPSGVVIPHVEPSFIPRVGGGGGPDIVSPSSSSSSSSSLRATWLGHASYLLEFPNPNPNPNPNSGSGSDSGSKEGGFRVLTDPVFEARCAPSQHIGPKRYSPCPVPGSSAGSLPAIDAVLISHSHYDHLSWPTVQDIVAHHPGVHFFVGSGLGKWFLDGGLGKGMVTEMDWWEEVDVCVSRFAGEEGEGEGEAEMKETKATIAKAKITCLPSQHTSGRTGLDKDTTLWASWAVSSGGKTAWFGGDTGYRAVPKPSSSSSSSERTRKDDLPGHNDDNDDNNDYAHLPHNPDFSEIGRLRGPFDLGLIPIGAYKPRHLMSPMHADPYDAVEIFKDTRCRRAMGIHWGAWVLTTEDPEEPPKMLGEALKKSGIAETGVFDVCALGESRDF